MDCFIPNETFIGIRVLWNWFFKPFYWSQSRTKFASSRKQNLSIPLSLLSCFLFFSFKGIVMAHTLWCIPNFSYKCTLIFLYIYCGRTRTMLLAWSRHVNACMLHTKTHTDENWTWMWMRDGAYKSWMFV